MDFPPSSRRYRSRRLIPFRMRPSPTALSAPSRIRLLPTCGQPAVGWFAMMSGLTSLLAALRGAVRARAALHLEVLALRHQLQSAATVPTATVRLANADRWLWASLSQVWSGWRTALVIVHQRPSSPGIAREPAEAALGGRSHEPCGLRTSHDSSGVVKPSTGSDHSRLSANSRDSNSAFQAADGLAGTSY